MSELNDEINSQLGKILDVYRVDWKKRNLNGEDVEILTNHLKNRLNLINGNINQWEFEYLENKLKK